MHVLTYLVLLRRSGKDRESPETKSSRPGPRPRREADRPDAERDHPPVRIEGRSRSLGAGGTSAWLADSFREFGMTLDLRRITWVEGSCGRLEAR